MMKNNNKAGVYIHIPFCVKKCRYCDFLSFQADERLRTEYVEALCREISSIKDRELCVDTVFIGGGTPSVLSESQMEKILYTLRENTILKDACEITVEINPGTMDTGKAAFYKEYGINRISMGVQALNDGLLERLGRIHKKEDAYKTFFLLREAGFDNINTDLMFSLPGQTVREWEETLDGIIDMRPEHISFYGLIIEEGTPFFEELKAGRLKEADDNTDRRMYRLALSKLKAYGYEQYEISNAALPGKKSLHNLKYWSMEDYIGFGLGAHSFENGVRYCNTSEMKEYLQIYQKKPIDRESGICVININTVKDNAEEFMFTGLRKTEGVLKSDFKRITGLDIDKVYSEEIKRMEGEALLSVCGDRICLTEKGTDLSNYVMREFIKEKW